MSGELRRALERDKDFVLMGRIGLLHDEINVSYKRHIEDLKRILKKTYIERECLLDFKEKDGESVSIENLKHTVEDFVKRDVHLCLKIMNVKISINEAESRYLELFGEKEK